MSVDFKNYLPANTSIKVLVGYFILPLRNKVKLVRFDKHRSFFYYFFCNPCILIDPPQKY